MIEHPLYIEYKKLCPGIRKLYVVPKINYSSRRTDYVYLLYKDFLENKKEYQLTVESLSVFRHYEIIFSRFRKKNSLLHYHWLEITDLKSLAGMFWKLFCVSIFKISGGKLIWTVHNKFPHCENFKYINGIIRKYFAFLADKLHVHCRTAVSEMASILKVKEEKFFVVRHPEYPVQIIPKHEATDLLIKKYFLNINLHERKNILMFGAIADYKGIIQTVELFKNHFENLNLIIAGPVKRWDRNYLKAVLKAAEGSQNILVIAENIPDDLVPAFLNAADCLLFNFSDILTSGSVLLGLNYRKKIIAPSIGCLAEINDPNIIKFEAGNIEEIKQILKSA